VCQLRKPSLATRRGEQALGKLSRAFNIRTAHRQRLGSGIISRSGEIAAPSLPPLPFLNLHKIRVDSDKKR
jgi:hypothetical protein